MTNDYPPPEITPHERRLRLYRDTVRALDWLQENQKRPVDLATTDWFLKRVFDWQMERDA